ncbi:alpha/beta hydrolase family protein [Bradyrhizobium yuanmingense]|uniref:alpha/beta hydrolase family protein n=1 Tax=Bradyrhizobium yuanmingense TaxID=108015 RepID=UPI0023B8CEE2|nr:acetylhydrolase [Bradyrhizobium yuanmingense]MDF0582642.1 acetylhydrolase [Bradyrhizobium yuanmingense]
MRSWLAAMALACAVGMALPEGANAQNAQVQQEHATFRAVDFDWIDTSRGREVPARLYWPTEASPGRVPLIIFSHGMGGSRNGYTYLAARWAAHGIASLHVQHIGSDSSLWRGNPFELVGRLQAATRDDEAAARVGDIRFALDQMLLFATGPYARFIDMRRIAVAGHSYGANTALLTVGARVVRDGRWLDFRDRRFKAAIVISAPPFYGEKDLPSVLANIAVPTLHVTATQDVIKIPGFYSAARDRVAIFEAIANRRKLLVMFQGGSHSIFTDRALTGGPGLNPKVKESTGDLTLAFLDYAFAGDSKALAQWSFDWQDILAQPTMANTIPISGATAQSDRQGHIRVTSAEKGRATTSEQQKNYPLLAAGARQATAEIDGPASALRR